jgi:hypothetical protein
MPLTLPSLGDASYQSLRDAALARIPVHNPEWTNFNPSDPGVTLVELFAFMTENLLYRANLIPERNRLKFLSLLGVPLQPGSSAVGVITFTNDRGPLQTLTLPTGVEVSAGKVPFRTQQGLDVLPVEGRVYFKRAHPASDTTVTSYYNALYAALQTGQQTPPDLALYDTVPLESIPGGVDLGTDAVDHCLWIALLVRTGDKPADNSDAAWSALKWQVREQLGGRTLSLGLVPFADEAARQLETAGPINPQGSSLLQYWIPQVQPVQPGSDQGVLGADRQPVYSALAASASADLLTEPSVIQLTLPPKEKLILWSNLQPLEDGTDNFPPAISDTALSQRLLTWIKVSATSSAQAKILWTGINSTLVQQRAHVVNESLPIGTGEPDQVVVLAKTPVLPDSVQLTVIPPGGPPEQWTRIDDLMSAGPEVPVPDPSQPPGTPLPQNTEIKVFTLDSESGTIQFGDGARGARPPLAATLRADYDYGVASAGNVGKNAINSGTGLPAGMKVTNPVPTWGGVDAETASEGEKQISRYLQHRDRLVSALDFETITLRTPGVDVGRVDVLAAYSPELAGNEPGDAPGAVTLMVVPQYDAQQPNAPVPDSSFLNAICNYLDSRRLITTEVFLRGPNYHPIWVSVGINVVAGKSIAEVTANVKTAVLQFLSPLPPDGKEQIDSQAALLTTPQDAQSQKGWPLRKAVAAPEIIAVVNRVSGVLSVNKVLLADQTSSEADSIAMTGLELPQVMGISVVSGDRVPTDQLRGQSAASTTGGPGGPATTAPKSVPVPVIPTEC